MTEFAGLAMGGLSLAALFTTCVDCFDYIQLGRNFGKDYNKCLLKLNVVKLRLNRWGESVNIFEGDFHKYHMSAATAQDEETVKRILGQILAEFQSAEKLSRRYAARVSVEDPSTTTDANNDGLEGLVATVRSLAIQRQRKTSFSKKFKWAIYEKNKFNELVDNVDGFVKDLVDLFPASQPQQAELCADEVQQIANAHSVKELSVLEEASSTLDDTLRQNVARVIQRRSHCYENITVKGRARMKSGDEIALGAAVVGYGHTYKNITASDDARVLNGNSYGQKSVFDD